MPKLNKADKRDSKRHKDRYGHKEDGRSVKLIQEILIKKSKKNKKKQDE